MPATWGGRRVGTGRKRGRGARPGGAGPPRGEPGPGEGPHRRVRPAAPAFGAAGGGTGRMGPGTDKATRTVRERMEGLPAAHRSALVSVLLGHAPAATRCAMSLASATGAGKSRSGCSIATDGRIVPHLHDRAGHLDTSNNHHENTAPTEQLWMARNAGRDLECRALEGLCARPTPDFPQFAGPTEEPAPASLSGRRPRTYRSPGPAGAERLTGPSICCSRGLGPCARGRGQPGSEQTCQR